MTESVSVTPAIVEQGVSGKSDEPSAETLANGPRSDSLRSSTYNSHAVPKTEEEALAGVLDQLQQIGAIDPQAQQQLMADLHSAKPEHWSLIVQQFQSALAYRQQLADREPKQPIEQPIANNESRPSPHLIQEVASSMSNDVAIPVSFDTKKPRVPVQTPQEVLRSDSRLETSTAIATDSELSEELPPKELSDDSAKPLLPPPSRSNLPSDGQPSASAAVSGPSAVRQVAYVAPTRSTSSWQDHLQTTINELEQSVRQTPGSTDEVHEHMRLRLLYLLAGQEEETLLPIPGATPSQQDYWAKQMFAVSTFLDSASQSDSKRRAAGTLVHLDQARSKLAELATLQVRNLLFVNTVDGFGVYKPRKETKFRPGDPVKLYTEVENFRSDSTEEGNRTVLATSYQVLDKNGQRVDGAQFPDVEDLCHNLRRDFHMQYEVALPTRIYPGEYELRLIITDQLSHKIGQASVPFEIVE